MQIEIYEKNKYQIIKVKEKDEQISDISELSDLITGYLKRGKIFIAISFTDATYIYSGAIRILIDCYKKIQKQGGDLCIIEPNPSLFDVLELLNIDRVINIYVSEKFLPEN